MARQKLQDTLDHLAVLRAAGYSQESLPALKKALADTSPHVVAKAAAIVSEFQAHELIPDLITAFPRFMNDALTTDKGCYAKTQIALSLYELAAPADEVFLPGIRHFQPEPSYGDPRDSAGPLRGHCAFGLVRMLHPDAMALLADLLADPETQARTLCARALGYTIDTAPIPLLRYKANIGDTEPAVTAECLASLLLHQKAKALPFIQQFLDEYDHTAELTALYLGESRLPEALPILTRWLEKTIDKTQRKTALVAIASLRQDAANTFLIDLIKDANTATATMAIAALEIYRHDPNIKSRVLAAAGPRANSTLKSALNDAFPD